MSRPARQRIACLLPSATEICFALGLGERVVGVSHECDFPSAARSLPVLTSATIDSHASSAAIDRDVRSRVASGLSIYRVDEEKLRALRPDLIVTQDACEVCAVSFAEVCDSARRALGADVEVLSLAPLRFADVLDDILRVGRAAGILDVAERLVAELHARVTRLSSQTERLPRPRVLMLEWLDPPMVGGHWTPELIERAGGDPVLGHPGAPTRSEDWRAIARAEPEHVLIAPCGFRLEQTLREIGALDAAHPLWQLAAVREGRAAIVDGNAFFNRSGPRLVESAEIAALSLHGARGDGAHVHGPQDWLPWSEVLAKLCRS